MLWKDWMYLFLQNYLLNPVLGIEDPKTDKRIDFVGGIRGLAELERRVHTGYEGGIFHVSYFHWGTFAVADAGRLMPRSPPGSSRSCAAVCFCMR